MFIYSNPNKIKRVSQGLGETREHWQNIEGKKGTWAYVKGTGEQNFTQYENMVPKFIEERTLWKMRGNIVQLWRGTREQGPPPDTFNKKIHSLPSNSIISLDNIFSYDQVSSIIIIYSILNIKPKNGWRVKLQGFGYMRQA